MEFALEKPATKTGDKNRRQKPAIKKVAIKSSDKKVATKSCDKAVAKKTQAHREKILALIHERGEVSTTEVCQVLGLQEACVRQILSGMVADSLIEAEGANKSRRYRTKRE